jgi:hypothetical protein
MHHGSLRSQPRLARHPSRPCCQALRAQVERNPHVQAHPWHNPPFCTGRSGSASAASRSGAFFFFFMKASVSATTRAGFGEPCAPTRFLESGLRDRDCANATARRATSKRRSARVAHSMVARQRCGAKLWQICHKMRPSGACASTYVNAGRPLTLARRAWRLALRWAWRDAPDPRSDAEAGEATGMGRGRIMGDGRVGSRNRWAVRGSSVCVIEDVRVDASDLTR